MTVQFVLHGLALKSAVTQRTSQSRLRLASSPDRGATGVPVLVLLDELGFSKPETEVLRCLGTRHLCINPALPGHPRRVSGVFHRKKPFGLGVLHKICAGTQKEENKKEKTDFF